MRIRATESGAGWELYAKGRRIGRVRDDTVTFVGFASDDEAARAAGIAHRALLRRRGDAARPEAPEEYLFGHTDDGQFVIARSGVVARLLPPEPVTGEEGWGFEIALRHDEASSVFAMARARVMWNALRASGLARRMAQFAGTIGGPV